MGAIQILKGAVNGALRPLGYEVNNLHLSKEQTSGWGQYKYVKPDGSFDYDYYRSVQEKKSRRDDQVVWVQEDNIKYLAEYLKRNLKEIRFGICHGSKRGKELEWFIKHLGPVHILGTDLAEWTADFPNTIQWDFHETKPEWNEAADFIYSNALDHSYDPEKAVEAWMSSLRSGGCCLIEWHVYGEPLNATDPFSADLMQLVYAITKWGKGRYCVRELLPSVTNPKFVSMIVIYKF